MDTKLRQNTQKAVNAENITLLRCNCKLLRLHKVYGSNDQTSISYAGECGYYTRKQLQSSLLFKLVVLGGFGNVKLGHITEAKPNIYHSSRCFQTGFYVASLFQLLIIYSFHFYIALKLSLNFTF